MLTQRVRFAANKAFCSLRCFCNIPMINEHEFEGFSQPQRNVKVAILGAPNAGKSTLINKLVGHPVLCVSKKVHTTRKRERAAINKDNSQVLFVDTPGLVSHSSIKKHNLDEPFRLDGLRAVAEANIVGIIHDAANKWTRRKLDPNIVHILQKMEKKKTFLVLNKVDAVKQKDGLLDLINSLTKAEATETISEESSKFPKHLYDDAESKEKKKRRPRITSWPHFSEVFMVSALNGDGVKDLLDFLLAEAREGAWALPEGTITDRPWPTVLQELVRGRLLDALPQEVPYNLVIETEYFHINDLGEVIAVVLVTCPLQRHQKMLVAGSGRIVREVATLAENDARSALKTNVRLRVVVTAKENKKERSAA